MASPAAQSIFDVLSKGLDIPRSYYQKAAGRYSSIEEWLQRPGSTVSRYSPRVYPQGSFRLGTVNRPLLAKDEYDLDLVCELTLLSVDAITQKDLKALLGEELRAYVKANCIESPLVERKRCWRIDYADDVKFHIDSLPCVPHHSGEFRLLESRGVAPTFAKRAIALTCKTHPQYEHRTRNWPTSNPNGFALWFEDRFGPGAINLRERLVKEGFYRATSEVPTFELKTPLQIAVQILKRHRDVMFRDNSDLKPISMILTTLSAHAYERELTAELAVTGILERMPAHVRPQSPRVANPVNPAEDFADKWAANPRLEESFWRWHLQASRDFAVLANPVNAPKFQKLVEERLALSLPTATAAESSAPAVLRNTAPPAVVIRDGPRPWERR